MAMELRMKNGISLSSSLRCSSLGYLLYNKPSKDKPELEILL